MSELPDESTIRIAAPDAGGACDHLLGAALPSLRLESTVGEVDIDTLASGLLALFIYPHATGLADAPVPGWDAIPGARGCTAQSCGFRDEHNRVADLGASIAGLSVQTSEEQRQFAARVGLQFPLISDPGVRLAASLRLPTFTAGDRIFYERLTLIARAGSIVKVFHPVPAPERNAADVLRWLTGEAQAARG
jgi:peroxiredoxin